MFYEKAGFKVSAPGCSYCVGTGADRAGDGEVWLTSQNRNFENRMGKGAIGNLASAATVAASLLLMKVTDPKPYLDAIDRERLREMLGHKPQKNGSRKGPTYVEPSSQGRPPVSAEVLDRTPIHKEASINPPEDGSTPRDIKRGKIQVLGDFIDTDALAPADSLMICKTDEEFGQHCLKHTHPEFRSRAAHGYNIVVVGKAFGCGSSRENAVSALLGCGIQAVIAKSFSFIYGRNTPNLGLLGVVIQDETFHEAAADGEDVEIDLGSSVVRLIGCGGEMRGPWAFDMSDMEKELIEIGGITNAF